MTEGMARVVEALEAADSQRQGDDWQCPAHDDRNASLTVKAGDRADVVLHCHAGCESEDILAALRLEWGDLFEDEPPERPSRQARPKSKAQAKRPCTRVQGSTAPSKAQVSGYAAALAENEPAHERLWSLRRWTPQTIRDLHLGLDRGDLTIPVTEADGSIAGLLRFQPNPERRNGTPKIRSAKGSRRQLFPPPESIDGDQVVLVEGEPDAITAWSAGLPAVGIPGVNGWKAEWADRFRDRDVIIAFDCDEPGRAAANRIASDLFKIAAQARVVDLEPSRDDGYDFTDLALEAETEDELRQVGRNLLVAAKWTMPLQPCEVVSEVRR